MSALETAVTRRFMLDSFFRLYRMWFLPPDFLTHHTGAPLNVWPSGGHYTPSSVALCNRPLHSPLVIHHFFSTSDHLNFCGVFGLTSLLVFPTSAIILYLVLWVNISSATHFSYLSLKIFVPVRTLLDLSSWTNAAHIIFPLVPAYHFHVTILFHKRDLTDLRVPRIQ